MYIYSKTINQYLIAQPALFRNEKLSRAYHPVPDCITANPIHNPPISSPFFKKLYLNFSPTFGRPPLYLYVYICKELL